MPPERLSRPEGFGFGAKASLCFPSRLARAKKGGFPMKMSDPDRSIVVPYKLLRVWLCCQSGANGSLRANSLLSGKIQGNFADLAAKTGRRLGFPTIDQRVAHKFPKHLNRELFRRNREFRDGNRDLA